MFPGSRSVSGSRYPELQSEGDQTTERGRV